MTSDAEPPHRDEEEELLVARLRQAVGGDHSRMFDLDDHLRRIAREVLRGRAANRTLAADLVREVARRIRRP